MPFVCGRDFLDFETTEGIKKDLVLLVIWLILFEDSKAIIWFFIIFDLDLKFNISNKLINYFFVSSCRQKAQILHNSTIITQK